MTPRYYYLYNFDFDVNFFYSYSNNSQSFITIPLLIIKAEDKLKVRECDPSRRWCENYELIKMAGDFLGTQIDWLYE